LAQRVLHRQQLLPAAGPPVAEIRDSRLNAEMVYLGSSIGAPPGAPSPRNADTAAPDDAAVMATERDWARALAGKGTLRVQFDAVLDAWVAALEFFPPVALSPEAGPGRAGARDSVPAAAGPGGGLEPEIAGFLRASLRVPAWRDAVLVMAAAGRDAAATGAEAFGIFSADDGRAVSCPSLPEARLTPGGLPSPVADGPDASSTPGAAQLSGTGKGANRYEQVAATGCPGDVAAPDGGPDDLPGYGEVLLGLSPPVPDWDTLKRLESLMQELSSCGGGEAQAAALTAVGWIEWCRGRGSFAHASLTRALEATPGYRLAELLSEVVRRGTICGWAGRREAAWQKFGPDAA
jgi:hypothetical protein